jgi:hypothetical protein
MNSRITSFSAKQPNSYNSQSSQTLQVIASRTFINIIKYATFAFFVGSLLEYVMPQVSRKKEKKDVFVLILEVLMQISIIIFSFMYLITFGGARLGLITYLIVVMACQPTLNLKINTIREKVFKINHDEKDEKEENVEKDEKEENVEKDENNAQNLNSKISQKIVQPVTSENMPPPNVFEQSTRRYESIIDGLGETMSTSLADLPTS